jgi:hypothetical protein
MVIASTCAAVAAVGRPLQPKEIIEHTFNVFCGHQQTMDEVGFAKFCESSKRVIASDASIIFTNVVQNVHNGMDLNEFKAALGLLVNFSKTGGNRTPVEKIANGAIRPARPSSRGKVRVSTSGAEPKITASTFRWSPLAIVESVEDIKESRLETVERQKARKASRTIRWCPAEVDDEEEEPYTP